MNQISFKNLIFSLQNNIFSLGTKEVLSFWLPCKNERNKDGSNFELSKSRERNPDTARQREALGTDTPYSMFKIALHREPNKFLSPKSINFIACSKATSDFKTKNKKCFLNSQVYDSCTHLDVKMLNHSDLLHCFFQREYHKNSNSLSQKHFCTVKVDFILN